VFEILHVGTEPSAPSSVAGLGPGSAFDDVWSLQLVHRRIHGLAIDRWGLSRSEAAGNARQRGDMLLLVPVVKVYLNIRWDVRLDNIDEWCVFARGPHPRPHARLKGEGILRRIIGVFFNVPFRQIAAPDAR
jgi:hypothetical protein